MHIELNSMETSVLYAELMAQVGCVSSMIASSTDQDEIDDLCDILTILHGIIDKLNEPCQEKTTRHTTHGGFKLPHAPGTHT